MEYKIVINEDGVENWHPILTDEEKEEKHQEFLKVANEIIRKYSTDDK